MIVEFNQSDTALVLKYLPETEGVRLMVHLRATADPRVKHLLVLTASSIIKFLKKKAYENFEQIYLRHMTGVKIELDRPRKKPLIWGIILASIGGFLIAWMFLSILFLWGIPLVTVGGLLILYAFLKRRGRIRIYSYDTDTPFVDAKFSGLQTEHVLNLVKQMDKFVYQL